jgi:hypothetical protein
VKDISYADAMILPCPSWIFNCIIAKTSTDSGINEHGGDINAIARDAYHMVQRARERLISLGVSGVPQLPQWIQTTNLEQLRQLNAKLNQMQRQLVPLKTNSSRNDVKLLIDVMFHAVSLISFMMEMDTSVAGDLKTSPLHAIEWRKESVTGQIKVSYAKNGGEFAGIVDFLEALIEALVGALDTERCGLDRNVAAYEAYRISFDAYAQMAQPYGWGNLIMQYIAAYMAYRRSVRLGFLK